MPCQIQRPTADQPFIVIRLTNPLTLDEAREVRDALSDIILKEEPLAALVDLTGVDSLSLLSIGMNDLDEFIPGTLGYHTHHSRIALLNCGTALKFALSIAGGYADAEAVRDFTSEEKAVAWLMNWLSQP